MKSASTISLSKAWWKKETPEGLKKSGPLFEKALVEYEKAEGGLGRGKAEASAKAVEKALDHLSLAGRQVASEARTLAKKEKDKKRKADLANTEAVMGKPLSREISSVRDKIRDLLQAAAEAADREEAATDAEDDEDASAFGTAEAHAAYLKTWAPKLKRRSMNFALGLPSNAPEEMRFIFHPKKGGRSLANTLKKEAGARKFTFGRAGTEKLVEAVGDPDDDLAARTLCLEIEGRRIPALAKRVRLMLRSLGIPQFTKVKILVGPDEVEGSDEQDQDPAVPDVDLSEEKDAAEEGAEEGASDEAALRDRLAAALSAPVLPADGLSGEQQAGLAAAAARVERLLAEGATEEAQVLVAMLSPAEGEPRSLAAANLADAGGDPVEGDAGAARSVDLTGDDAPDDEAAPGQGPEAPTAEPRRHRRQARKPKMKRVRVYDAVPVRRPMTAGEFEVYYYQLIDGMSRADATAYAQDPKHWLHPRFAITSAIVERRGFVRVGRLVNVPLERDPAERAAIDARIAELPERARDRLNALADRDYYQTLNYKVGEPISKTDPNYPLLRETWLATRRDMQERIERFEAIPGRVRDLVPFGHDGKSFSPAAMDAMIELAEKLAPLDQRALANLKRRVPKDPGSFTQFVETLDRLLHEEHMRQTTGGGDFRLGASELTGQVVAEVGLTIGMNYGEGDEWRLPVTLHGRADRSLGSLAQSTAFARRLGKPAAVMLVGGRYEVHDVKARPPGDDLLNDITRLDKDYTADPTDAMLWRRDKRLQAIVSKDGYVFHMASGRARIMRSGGEIDPFAAAMGTYGVGLKHLADRKEFLRIFAFAMRDAAYFALQESERELDKLADRLASGAVDPEMREQMRKVSAELDQVEPKILKLEQRAKELPGEWEDAMRQRVGAETLLISAKIGLGQIPPGDSDKRRELEKQRDHYSSRLEDAKAKIAANEAEKRSNAKQRLVLEQKRSEIAREFPFLLRIDFRSLFLMMRPSDQAEMAKDLIAEVRSNIDKTRANIDREKLELWEFDRIVHSAIAALSLDKERIGWVKEKAKDVRNDKAIFEIALAAFTIGLAVGAAFFTGGTSLALLGSSMVLGVVDAAYVTEDRYTSKAAANIALNPAEGIIDQADVPHWGWVALAWAGVGLDAFEVVTVSSKAFRKAMIAELKLAYPAGVASAEEISDEVLERAVRKILPELDPADAKALVSKQLRPALMGKSVRSFDAATLSDEAFDVAFKTSGHEEAVTTFVRNSDGSFDFKVYVRGDADAPTRNAAIAEELGHLRQLNDPEYAEDVFRLSEGQLSTWATKSTDEKIRTYMSQRKMERDLAGETHSHLLNQSARKRGEIAALEAKVAEGTAGPADIDKLNAAKAELEDIAFDTTQAMESLSRYAKEYDALAAAQGTGRLPDFADPGHPPRLFSTRQYEKTNKAARQDLRLFLPDSAPGAKVPPEGYYFKKGGEHGYQMVRFPGFHEEVGETAYRLVKGKSGGFKIEPFEVTQEYFNRSAEVRRASVLSKNGTPLRDLGALETAMGRNGLTDYQCAYVRTYKRSLRKAAEGGALGASGKSIGSLDVDKMVEGLGGLSDAAFETAFRGKMRAALVGHIGKAFPQDAAARVAAMAFYKDGMLNASARGEFFSAFRRANMEDELGEVRTLKPLKKADRKTGDLNFKTGERRADDLVEVEVKGRARKNKKGPRESGTYLIEDKSSLEAFKGDQFFDYQRQFVDAGDGDLVMRSGRAVKGLAYVFPDKKAAAAALDILNKNDFDPRIHVGYYEKGVLKWAR